MDGLTLDAQGLDQLTLTMAKILPATSRSAGDQFWLTQTRTVERTTGTAATFAPRLERLLERPGRQPLATFRIGFPARVARRSPRRPLAEVTR